MSDDPAAIFTHSHLQCDSILNHQWHRFESATNVVLCKFSREGDYCAIGIGGHAPCIDIWDFTSIPVYMTTLLLPVQLSKCDRHCHYLHWSFKSSHIIGVFGNKAIVQGKLDEQSTNSPKWMVVWDTSTKEVIRIYQIPFYVLCMSTVPHLEQYRDLFDSRYYAMSTYYLYKVFVMDLFTGRLQEVDLSRAIGVDAEVAGSAVSTCSHDVNLAMTPFSLVNHATETCSSTYPSVNTPSSLSSSGCNASNGEVQLCAHWLRALRDDIVGQHSSQILCIGSHAGGDCSMLVPIHDGRGYAHSINHMTLRLNHINHVIDGDVESKGWEADSDVEVRSSSCRLLHSGSSSRGRVVALDVDSRNGKMLVVCEDCSIQLYRLLQLQGSGPLLQVVLQNEHRVGDHLLLSRAATPYHHHPIKSTLTPVKASFSVGAMDGVVHDDAVDMGHDKYQHAVVLIGTIDACWSLLSSYGDACWSTTMLVVL